MDQEIYKQIIHGLSEYIVTNVDFGNIKESLVSQGIINDNDANTIEAECGNRAQMLIFLDQFCRQDLELVFPKFTDILSKCGKKHVTYKLQKEKRNIEKSLPRDMDTDMYRYIINSCCTYIASNTDFNQMRETLISRQLLHRDHISAIEGQKGNSNQVSAFLDYLCQENSNLDQKTYKQFKQVLCDFSKTHVIRQLETKEKEIWMWKRVRKQKKHVSTKYGKAATSKYSVGYPRRIGFSKSFILGG